MKPKLDENGKPVFDENNIQIWVHDDGKEIAYDPNITFKKISELNSENAKRKTDNNELKEKLEPLLQKLGENDLDDLLKAQETVQNLNDKKLIEAGEVETLKRNLSETYESKLKSYETQIEHRDKDISKLVINNRFYSSNFLEQKAKNFPRDFLLERFAKHFKPEKVGDDLVPVGYLNGEKILSRINPGEFAGFDEAIEALIDQHPQKDRILDAPEKTGTGSKGSGYMSKQDTSAKTTQQKVADGLKQRLSA